MISAPRPSAAIDVLIPAFNAASSIADTVASIQRQTVSDIRIIVVDDGSTDDTLHILSRLAAEDSRIEILAGPNGGIVDARNRGLALCTADLVAGQDADDIAFPTRLEEQRRYMLENPDCVAVDCHYWHIDENGVRTGKQTDTHGDAVPDAFSVPSEEPYLMHTFMMARVDALRTIGGYRDVVYAEDTDLYWRLLPLGKLHHIPILLGEYRIHSASTSSASILNGRISAVNSQLAALSYRRRVADVPDLDFPREKLDRYRQAGSLRKIIDVASDQLRRDEANYLALAACVKLMKLSLLRPYMPDSEDAETIASVIKDQAASLSPRDRALIDSLKAKLSFKLIRGRQWKSAALLTPRMLPVGQMFAEKAARAAKRIVSGSFA